MLADDGVEARVEVVEQVDYLDGLTDGWDGSEAHYVAEVECHLREVLRLHWLPCLESLSHRPERGAGAQEQMGLTGRREALERDMMEEQTKELNLNEKSGVNQSRALMFDISECCL